MRPSQIRLCTSPFMAFQGLLISEIFHSLQGETSLTGVPMSFIRLTGCNLRCAYCDTAYAFKGGTRMTVDEVITALRPHRSQHVLITGGEPLLQRTTPLLAQRLQAQGYQVSIETHGEVPIAAVAPYVRVVMDIKTPASGMSRGGFVQNLPLLKKGDEIKFVIAAESDYVWAKELLTSPTSPLTTIPNEIEVLFSASNAVAHPLAPYPGVSARWLAERLIQDQAAGTWERSKDAQWKIRLQTQLHKALWGTESRGV